MTKEERQKAARQQNAAEAAARRQSRERYGEWRSIQELETRSIQPTGDREVDEDLVPLLMRSIEELGQLHPIIVWQPTSRSTTFRLVDGRQRLEACRRLGRTIRARVRVGGQNEYVQEWIKQVREAAEIHRR